MNILRPSQEQGAAWLAAHRRAYLGDKPGFGKTPQLITAANRVGAEQPLVICPAIARDMWSRQWKRWGLPSVTPRVISYDALTRLEGVVEPHDLLILDEAQYCKYMNAKRTRYAMRLANRAPRVWLASGTPQPNHVGNLYPMLRAVWPDLLKTHGVRSYGDYLARYAVTIETQYGIKVVGVQNTAELREMLDVIMLRRTEDEGLPPLRFEEFWLPFDPALPMEVLEAGVAARDWQDEIPADAAHATARRMLGALKAVPVGELIAQELEDGAYQKIVVGAYHHGVIDGLWTLLKPYGAVVVSGRTRPEHRRSRIAQFQSDPSARVFIGQLTACGTSIDLFAATEVALVEQSWAPDDNFQFCKRVHRTGQTSSVRVRSFYADCDLDEGVARVLARKTRLNGEVLY